MQVKRKEHKYILNLQEFYYLKQQIAAIMPLDKHTTSPDGYEIRSLYFDTIDDRACAEKEDGLQIHEKIRIRIYGNSDQVIKLESKRKDGEVQIKKSMFINQEILQQLINKNYAILLDIDSPMALYFYIQLQDKIPKVIIQYFRLSYSIPTNNTRITFDSHIGATESHIDLFKDPLFTYPLLPPNHIIMEVKYNHFLFGYIKNILKNMHLCSRSYSKYYNGRMFQRTMI